MTASIFAKKWTRQTVGLTALRILDRYNHSAKECFTNFNRSWLSLSADRAERFEFTGAEQPEPGDLIFFDATSRNPGGRIAIVYAAVSGDRVVIQEVKGDNQVWTHGTYIGRREIHLQHNPPFPGYGAVLGWLRLKL